MVHDFKFLSDGTASSYLSLTRAINIRVTREVYEYLASAASVDRRKIGSLARMILEDYVNVMNRSKNITGENKGIIVDIKS